MIIYTQKYLCYTLGVKLWVKKMEKIAKNNLKLFMGIVIGLFMSGIVVCASTILASNILYNDRTVEEAMDELYEKASKHDILILTVSSTNFSSSSMSQTGLYTVSLQDKYKYFKITDVVSNGNLSTCRVDSWKATDSSGGELELNVEYELDDYLWLNPFLETKGGNTRADCNATLLFYN